MGSDHDDLIQSLLLAIHAADPAVMADPHRDGGMAAILVASSELEATVPTTQR